MNVTSRPGRRTQPDVAHSHVRLDTTRDADRVDHVVADLVLDGVLCELIVLSEEFVEPGAILRPGRIEGQPAQ